MCMEKVLDAFELHIKNVIHKEVLKCRKCRALHCGRRCTKRAVTQSGLCRAHLGYSLPKVCNVIYHNHLPGEVAPDCPICTKPT